MFRSHPEKPGAGSDVERLQIRIAKGAVGRPVNWNRMRFQDPAVGRKNVNHRPRPALLPAGCGDDIALDIQAHAVNAAMGIEVVHHLVGANRAVVVEGIGP